MKISLNWLNDFVDITDYKDCPQDLADKLTDAGLEVEGVERLGDFENLKVGWIKELKKHPDADKLTVCQVDVGEVENGQPKLRQIVCGAKNHKEGDKVCAALPGCVLPGDFKIKKSKIRGQESLGMLCSDSELALSEEADGIRILDKDAPVGEDVANYLGLKDSLLEVSVTPNRADCLSHWGLAREVSCLLGRELKSQTPKLKASKESLPIEIEVQDSKACPRFTGRILKGLKLGPSPSWIQTRLQNCGINSVNNVVDITNYVMLEYGQPMHAYDLRFIKGGKMIVGPSHEGEAFTSFDGSEFVLSGEELCIRDHKSVIGLAGVVGSKNSGVVDDTQEIFLECAYFLPSSVRKTSRRFGIETDAGYRFARGTDIEMLEKASDRACELLCQYAGASVASETKDIYLEKVESNDIEIQLSYLTQRLGFEASEEKLESWLKRLFCEFKKNGSTYTVTPPTFRYDLFTKEDLVEEYGRLEGFDHIPEVLPEMSKFPSQQDPKYVQERALCEGMASLGFSQAYNYSFSSSQEEKTYLGPLDALTAYNVGHKFESVKLKNPLNEQVDVMRSSLAPQLYKNALHNWKYGSFFGNLFESGSVFYKNLEGQYCEESRLGVIVWGSEKNYWQSPQDEMAWPAYKLKSTLEALFGSLGIRSFKFKNVDLDEEVLFYHPKQVAQIIVEGKSIGLMGSLHPALLEEDKFRTAVAFCELNTDFLFRNYPKLIKVKPPVYFPIVRRDVTFELPQTVEFEELSSVVSKSVGKNLISIDLKDIYKGDRLKAGEHAITLSLALQDENKSIEDGALDKIQKNIFKAVETRFKTE